VLALLPLRVPPPAVVAAATGAGIGAAVEIARGQFGLAALLIVLKTVLDNADGQLARATRRTSAFGRYLDSEADLLVDAALFAGLGYATGAPLLALAAFVVLTTVLSVNFNLRRLYEFERGSASAEPEEGGLVRRIYALVYAPQDRAVERLVARRLRGRDEVARLAYHDRATIAVLHNLGLSGQMTAFAVCLAAGRPRLELWLVLACGLLLVPLEIRRGIRANHA